MISIHKHLGTQSFLGLVRAIEKVTKVTETYIPVLAFSVVLCLHVIFEKVRILKVFLTFSTLMFTLRNSSRLEKDYLFPERHELVLAEGALIAHADVVFGEDGQDLLVYSV